MDPITLISDATSPLVATLLTLAGLGLGLWVAVEVMTRGFYLLCSFITRERGGSHHSSRSHTDSAWR